MFKANNKKPGRRYWCRSVVVIVNFEHVSHLFLVFLLLTLNKHMLAEIMQSRHSDYFANFQHIQKDVNDVALVFLLLTLNIFDTFFQCF